MGVKIGPLLKEYNIQGREIEYTFLEGKKIAIDAFPTIYEMLTIIRDQRGGFLKDSKGRVTSHLVGIFNRTARMLALGIKPVYVFDGPPHPLKLKTLEVRQQRKEIAMEKYKKAVEEGDIEEMKKYAKQTVSLTEEIIESSKKLLTLLGVPVIQAPHDGEAQAAYLVKRGECYAVASPDYDAFLYGSPRVIRNLKMSLQKKEKPVLYSLDEVLSGLDISYDMLVDLAILIGTDFNPDGFEGIGPKKAYDLIRRYKRLEDILNRGIIKVKDIDLVEIKNIFKNPPITDDYKIEFSEPDRDGIISFLVDEHDFNYERVNKELSEVEKRLRREKKSGVQTSLESFFG